MTTTSEAISIIEDEHLAEENLLAELENEEIPSHIRDARMQNFRKQAQEFQLMQTQKHGQYTELAEEKEFLDTTTSENLCVVHFFHADFRRCAIMDTHLAKLAQKYFETKFVKINVDKAKFFVEKLKIQVLPAVISFKGGVVVDRIIGFEELGGGDDFRTSVVERRLAKCGVIPVCDIEDDDEGASDVRKNRSIFGRPEKKQTEDSDSDNDW